MSQPSPENSEQGAPGCSEAPLSPGKQIGMEAAVPTRLPSRRINVGRLAIAIVLCVVTVGALVWTVRQLNDPRKSGLERIREVIRFAELQAQWGPNDGKYAQEIEIGTSATYSFLFENVFSGPIQVGVESTSCRCSSVEAALIPAQVMAERRQLLQGRKGGQGAVFASADLQFVPVEQRYITVPENGHGLIRVAWKAVSPKGNPVGMRLAMTVWAQPRGKTAYRCWTNLEASTRSVPPVMFTREEVSLGTLKTASRIEAEVIGWSATRDQLNLRAAKGDDFFHWSATALGAEDCRRLEERLRKQDISTRVKSAFKLALAVNIAKDGKQLDQGPVEFRPALELDGQPLKIARPLFRALVPGPVEIDGLDEQGYVQLGKFKARAGTQRRLVLWAEPKVIPALDSKKVQSMNVKLQANPEQLKEGRKSWLIDIIVPPGSPIGPLEDNVVVIHLPTDPPRRARIPLVGTATPN